MTSVQNSSFANATSAFVSAPAQFTLVQPAAWATPAVHKLAHRNRDTNRLHAYLSQTSSTFTTPFRPGNRATIDVPSTKVRSDRTAATPVMVLDRVVVAGGTGFVGSRLVEKLVADGTSVVVLTRRPSSVPTNRQRTLAKYVCWNPGSSSGGSGDEAWIAEISGADAVINLCGESIATRWTPAAKRKIRASRLDSTAALVSALEDLQPMDRPKSLVSVSGVGYYGDDVAQDRVLTEDSPAGRDFLAQLCVEWERAASAAQKRAGVRVCIMRLGVVLGLQGGALAKMVPAFQAFVGGPLGSGKQWFPWVHVDDVVKALITAAEDESYEGPYNCVAPNVVSMNQMANSLGRALSRPALFPVPDFVLQLLLGEASSFLLAGHKAVPQKLADNGFQFNFRDIDGALRNIVQ